MASCGVTYQLRDPTTSYNLFQLHPTSLVMENHHSQMPVKLYSGLSAPPSVAVVVRQPTLSPGTYGTVLG